MKHILLFLSLAGLALCGSLNREYLPSNFRAISNDESGQFSALSDEDDDDSVVVEAPSFRSSDNNQIFGNSPTPSTIYGTPSSSFNRQFQNQYSPIAPERKYGAPSQNLEASTSYSNPRFSSGSRFGSQGTSQSYHSSPSVSQFEQGRGFGNQYEAPQQYYEKPQHASSFGAQPQFEGSPSSGYRSSSGYSGTVQDSNGGYIY